MRVLDDLRILAAAPADDVEIGMPPRPGTDAVYTYLWVIDARGVPYVLEEGRQELANELPKHTNLTGGEEAYAGGEMWFRTESSLWVSGKSGRYGPRRPGLLEDSVAVFRSYGYDVQSLGWDEAAGRPHIMLLEWS